ncbi:hypothetical protein ABTF26_21600, partial [Acinetobacter baumannii]
KQIARVLVELQTADAHTVDSKQILALEQRLMDLSDEVSGQYFTHREAERPMSADADEIQ